MEFIAVIIGSVLGLCFIKRIKQEIKMRKVNISEIERGLKIHNGIIETILEPGSHWVLNPLGNTKVHAFDVNKIEFSSPWTDTLLRNHPHLAKEYFTVADVSDKQIGLVYADGKFHRIVSPGQKVLFWKVLKNVTVEYVDFSEFQEIDAKKAKVITDKSPNASEFYFRLVPESHVGLLIVDGRLVRELPPGTYTFWKGRTSVEVAVIDMRILNLEVTGQDILTRDRVSLRLNFEAYYKIVEPAKALRAIKDLKDYLHKEFQFALRKLVGVRTLDEVLSRKESLGDEVALLVRDKALALGVEITSTGVKDIVLPGDIRAILNEVVSVEKKAQANLIRRREEVAATRSLLNTAKMMESSPALMRLKELEMMEKVSENVGTMNLVGGFENLTSKIGSSTAR